MTAKILAFAVEIEKVADVVTEKECREFLRVARNLPSTEISTYFKFGNTLRGREQLLSDARVSFPVLKALVACDNEVREEVLGRMSCGARIDTKEISVIRKEGSVPGFLPRLTPRMRARLQDFPDDW